MTILTKRNSSNIAVSLGAACALALGATSDAAPIFSTTFDNLDRDLALSLQDGWFTNDPYVSSTDSGQSDVVSPVTFYSATTGDYWGILGGLSPFAPGSFSVELAHSFSSAGLLTGALEASAVRFDVDFAITSSGVPRPDRDSFGWTFNDANGDLIFRLALEPNSAVAAEGLRLKLYNSQGEATITPNSIAYDAIYGLQVDVSLADANRDALTVRLLGSGGVPSTVLNEVDLPNGAAASLAQIGAQWNIKNLSENGNGDPNGFGANSILFNNYGVAVVPEPGSGLLLGLGSMLAASRRRRRN